MKNIRSMILGLLFLICFSGIFAQDYLDMELSRKGKFYVIPEMSFWMSTNYSYIELAPQLAYHLSDRFSIGLGPHYAHHREYDLFLNDIVVANGFGIRGFGRLRLLQNLGEYMPVYLFDDVFLHGEYEKMLLNGVFIDQLFAGFGVHQRATGGFSSYSIMLLWSLNDSYTYNNPTYRVGASIYF